MWRVHGFVSRVLSRCHGNGPLRISPGHQEEVINSPILSSNLHPSDCSQKEEDGEKRRKERTSQFFYSDLPHYTALDAVRWGAAAVLFMHLCRRIHSGFSVSKANQNQGPARPVEPGLLQKCGYKVILEIWSRRNILPQGGSVLCLKTPSKAPEHGSSDYQTTDSSPSDQQGEALSSDPAPAEVPETGRRGEEEDFLSPEEALTGAAAHLRQVEMSSVPVILNIIGLQSVTAGEDESAFSCFLASARLGYPKAQFNTGVCYERGRGVGRDLERAAEYYSQAAQAGHSQAQYRRARLLLASRGQQSTQDMREAFTLLEQAAASGLTQAQRYLGVLYSEEPLRDECKSVHYLKMAAESGDGEALLFLGQCYTRGFGVVRCIRTALELYKQAAAAGNTQARSLLRSDREGEVLRSIRSAPCFSVKGLLSSNPAPSEPALHSPAFTLPLPHSWSTGSLESSHTFSSIGYSPGIGHASWTMGVG